MADQLQLRFVRPRNAPCDLSTLCQWLKGKGWRKAVQIAAHLGFSDRYTRALANRSEGQIISGQKGYRLTLEATAEEVGHCVRWLRRQAEEMRARSIAIELVYHKAPYGQN